VVDHVTILAGVFSEKLCNVGYLKRELCVVPDSTCAQIWAALGKHGLPFELADVSHHPMLDQP
jgi:hypothetical protein